LILGHAVSALVLIMEVVEGETLAGRIPMALGDALPLFIQLAEGMEAAHEKGIVHRDLKPSNAMITQEGQIRILDSGLAKAFTPDESVSAASAQSPTLTKKARRSAPSWGRPPT